MTKLVRYQNGGLYAHHGAWCVAYRGPVRQENGSTKLTNKVKVLGSLKDYAREADILHLKTEFMLWINAGRFTPETNMTLSEFVEKYICRTSKSCVLRQRKEIGKSGPITFRSVSARFT